MSKITTDVLTRSDTGCFIAVPIWQIGNKGRERVKHVTKQLPPWGWVDGHANIRVFRGCGIQRHLFRLLTKPLVYQSMRTQTLTWAELLSREIWWYRHTLPIDPDT